VTFANTILQEKTARYLVERWIALFQISCRIEKCEHSVFFSKIMKADFQCLTLHWKSSIDHPLYTLKIFKYRNDVINFSRWFHPEYHQKIEEAQQEIDSDKKIQHLSRAEKILIEEAPLFPLYYEKEKIIKKRHLKNVLYFPSTGHFDLKNAYIER
jgi:dipeptide transport system substrate-binding protein